MQKSAQGTYDLYAKFIQIHFHPKIFFELSGLPQHGIGLSLQKNDEIAVTIRIR